MDDESLIPKLATEKERGIKYQERRHAAWSEIYNFYRDIIETNELTQRQEVNIPLMKETKKTLLSRIDEAPDIIFDCLEKGNVGREKELIINEKWKDDFDNCNFEGIDILEKNNVLLFGRTFKMLNIANGRVEVSVPHRLDLVVDPKTNPLDIETARYIVRLHIYKSLREILASDKYLPSGKNQLKSSLYNKNISTGVVIPFDKEATQEAKDKLLRDLGLSNFETLFSTDVEVELNEHFTLLWDEKKKKWVRYVIVVADESVILYKKTLKETIGMKLWPFTTWADDIETDDFWNDGMGDIIKTPNKIMNIFYSTYLENLTYRSLGMSWYLPISGYNPQTFEPEPFGQYPAPMVPDGKGSFLSVENVVKQMEIPAMTENLVGIEFLIKLVERATAATAIAKGVQEKKQITLGEVQELVAAVSERIVSISKFYRRSWKEFAMKWLKMYEANANSKSPFKLYKKSFKGNYFKKEVFPKDWVSQEGYTIRVLSSVDQEKERTKEIAELTFLQEKYPNNSAIQKIVRKRILGRMNLTPDELKEIEDTEKEMEASGMGNVPSELIPILKRRTAKPAAQPNLPIR